MKEDFGERLRRLREQKGLTQTALATLAGTYSSDISYYEAGKTEPRAQTLHNLATVLGVSMDYLWKGAS